MGMKASQWDGVMGLVVFYMCTPVHGVDLCCSEEMKRGQKADLKFSSSVLTVCEQGLP